MTGDKKIMNPPMTPDTHIRGAVACFLHQLTTIFCQIKILTLIPERFSADFLKSIYANLQCPLFAHSGHCLAYMSATCQKRTLLNPHCINFCARANNKFAGIREIEQQRLNTAGDNAKK
jgi:hypothetical protein